MRVCEAFQGDVYRHSLMCLLWPISNKVDSHTGFRSTLTRFALVPSFFNMFVPALEGRG